MEPKPYPYPAPTASGVGIQQQDTDQLNLLSVFYFILAGMAAVSGIFALIYILFGIVLLGGAAAVSERHGDESTGLAFAGGFVFLFGLGVTAAAWLVAGCLFLTGKFLREARNRTFCFVVAGLVGLNVPLGSLLGIFTFIVLSRDSVRARFEANQYPSFAPPGADFKKYS